MLEEWPETPTPKGHTGRWVTLQADIRENSTGVVREYTMPAPLEKEEKLSTWIWEEGNYACDCNRRLFFGYAIGEDYDDIDHPCGDSLFSVRIRNPRTKTVFYSDFVEDDENNGTSL